MSAWVSPDVARLEEVVAAARGRLLLCSPFVSPPALNIVANALPKKVNALEVWTRLDSRDWLTGASDPEGLLDFIRQVEEPSRPIVIRQSERLHAKIILSDGAKAMAGSANLTAGGFMRNIEAGRVATGREVEQLRGLVAEMRPKLQSVSREQFEQFVAQCAAAVETKEALLDLIRQEAPPVVLGQTALMPYRDFLAHLRSSRAKLAKDILRIATNEDGNNNTGKVKQAFFGVQRFLQEYPRHRPTAANLPIRNLSARNWFNVMDSDMADDWRRFLSAFGQETSLDYRYSMPTLLGYLTVAQGGTRRGGGGGDNEFKRVWPLAGRALRRFWGSAP